jgi:hypothetical protein
LEEPAEDEASTFDSQVYIFETAGLLISATEIDPNKQAIYLEVCMLLNIDGYLLIIYLTYY